jgi:hypothetical protein
MLNTISNNELTSGGVMFAEQAEEDLEDSRWISISFLIRLMMISTRQMM